MKKLFLPFFLLCTFLSFSAESALHDGEALVGKKFHRAKAQSPAYLECIEEFVQAPLHAEEHPRTIRDFDIKLFAEKAGLDVKKGAKVGAMRTARHDNCLEITYISINSDCQHRGFAFAAYETLFGLYRAPSRQKYNIDHFCCSVAEWNQESVGLHKKFGFLEDSSVQGHASVPGQPFLFLKR